MITKKLLNNKEISETIRKCYESDAEHMLKVLFDKEHGLDYSIKRTVNDFIDHGILLYGLYDNEEFIAYFGEESYNNEKYLTGFFIMPTKRKDYKKQFWNEVVKHFNGNFKAYMSDSNLPAKKFLINFGCKNINSFTTVYGIMNLFEYKENK